jgi:hypothetical protein
MTAGSESMRVVIPVYSLICYTLSNSDMMKMLPANPAVGNVNNNGPDMLDEPDSLSGRL